MESKKGNVGNHAFFRDNYPHFSLWIPVTIAKICFPPIVIICAKIPHGCIWPDGQLLIVAKWTSLFSICRKVILETARNKMLIIHAFSLDLAWPSGFFISAQCKLSQIISISIWEKRQSGKKGQQTTTTITTRKQLEGISSNYLDLFSLG